MPPVRTPGADLACAPSRKSTLRITVTSRLLLPLRTANPTSRLRIPLSLSSGSPASSRAPAWPVWSTCWRTAASPRRAGSWGPAPVWWTLRRSTWWAAEQHGQGWVGSWGATAAGMCRHAWPAGHIVGGNGACTQGPQEFKANKPAHIHTCIPYTRTRSAYMPHTPTHQARSCALYERQLLLNCPLRPSSAALDWPYQYTHTRHGLPHAAVAPICPLPTPLPSPPPPYKVDLHLAQPQLEDAVRGRFPLLVEHHDRVAGLAGGESALSRARRARGGWEQRPLAAQGP